MRRTPLLLLGLVAAVPCRGYELPQELRQRVETLIGDVAAAPSNAAGAAQRMAVLWEWANAVSLQDGFVPKNLPLVAVNVAHPLPGTTVNPDHLAAIDIYVRQLAWLDRDPEALGTITVTGAAAAPAATWQTFRVEWRVGSLGAREGGGILVSQHSAGAYGSLQVTDAQGENYVSISSSRRAVSFDLDQAPVWGPYGGFRTAQSFPVFRIRGGDLEAGDSVTLVYGDRSGGGRGLRVGPFSNDAIALPLHVDPGDGSFYELPLPTFSVGGAEAAGMHGFAPSIVAPGQPFTISVRTEDRFYNRASGEIPGYEVRRNGEVVGRLPPAKRFASFPSPSSNRESGVSASAAWMAASPGARIRSGSARMQCRASTGARPTATAALPKARAHPRVTSASRATTRASTS